MDDYILKKQERETLGKNFMNLMQTITNMDSMLATYGAQIQRLGGETFHLKEDVKRILNRLSVLEGEN